MNELVKTISKNVKMEMYNKGENISIVNKKVFNKDGDYLSRKLKGKVKFNLEDIYI